MMDIDGTALLAASLMKGEEGRRGESMLKTLELEFAAAVTQSQAPQDRQNGI